MVGQRVIRAIQGAQPTVTFIIANQNSPVPQHVFCDVYTVGDSFSSTPELSNDETQETRCWIILEIVLDIVVAEERKDSFNIDVIDNVHIDGDLETFEYLS